MLDSEIRDALTIQKALNSEIQVGLELSRDLIKLQQQEIEVLNARVDKLEFTLNGFLTSISQE